MSTSNTLTKTDLANILNEIVAIDGTDMTSQEIDDFVDSLNVTGINAVDYVVEEGTDNSWNYKKWNNGTFDAWISFSLNIARSTTSGSLYVSDTQTIDLPSFVNENINDWSISGALNGQESIWFQGFSASDKRVTYKLVGTTSRAAAGRQVQMMFHGKWK